MIVSLLGSAVIPWAKEFHIGERIVIPQVADLNLAILYIVAVLSTGVYGIVIGAWASNNKYALLGGIRAGAQIRDSDGLVHRGSGDDDRIIELKRDHGTAGRNELERVLSAPHLFYFPGMLFRGM